MSVIEMIDLYRIQLVPGKSDKIWLLNECMVKKHDALEEIRARKPEIIAELMQRKEAEDAETEAYKKAIAEREAKLYAIEGLSELMQARSQLEIYREALAAMMDDESNDGAFPPPRPTSNPAELSKQYPRAAAYLKAESYEFASNAVKSAAGKKAEERIINGEDYAAAIRDMETEWADYCTAHIWD